jgi:hypothetical protein
MTPPFNFKQTEFNVKDLNNGLILAKLSDLAYKGKILFSP